MKKYDVSIEFSTDYLQARFTEDAKKELENYISKGIVKTEDESWRVLMYEDDNGMYIPNKHFRETMVHAGKEFKVKKQKRSMMQWVISNILISPDKIYLGKKLPDKIEVSYPKRKDGTRVTLKHPSVQAGTKIKFFITSLDDGMERKAILNLLDTAGKMYGVGARRRDMFGRFKVLSFN